MAESASSWHIIDEGTFPIPPIFTLILSLQKHMCTTTFSQPTGYPTPRHSRLLRVLPQPSLSTVICFDSCLLIFICLVAKCPDSGLLCKLAHHEKGKWVQRKSSTPGYVAVLKGDRKQTIQRQERKKTNNSTTRKKDNKQIVAKDINYLHVVLNALDTVKRYNQKLMLRYRLKSCEEIT